METVSLRLSATIASYESGKEIVGAIVLWQSWREICVTCGLAHCSDLASKVGTDW